MALSLVIYKLLLDLYHKYPRDCQTDKSQPSYRPTHQPVSPDTRCVGATTPIGEQGYWGKGTGAGVPEQGYRSRGTGAGAETRS